MFIRRPLVFGVLTVLAAALAAGCASSGSTAASTTAVSSTGLIPPMPSGPLEKTHLLVYTPPTVDALGLYIAQYKHLFQAAGLTVTIKQASSDEDVINDQALGKIDVTVGNYASYFEAQENYTFKNMAPATYEALSPNTSTPQIPLYLLSADTYIVAEASILSQGYAGLFVAPGSGINSVAALQGKKIAINAQDNDAYLMISTFLEENGIDPSQETYVPYAFPRMQQALLDHKVQVAYLAEPYASIAEADGLSRLTDLDDGNTQDFPMAGYAVTKEFAERYPHTLQAFLHALEQGQQLADTNRQVAEQAVVAELAGVTPVTREQAAMISLESYPVGPPDLSRLQRVLNTAMTYGVITGDIFSASQMVRGLVPPRRGLVRGNGPNVVNCALRPSSRRVVGIVSSVYPRPKRRLLRSVELTLPACERSHGE
jgi:NitT/TauT family transport system substrate-binding protein